MVDLANNVDVLENWKEGCGVILRGANSTFCSGFDLLAAKRYSGNTEKKLELNLLMQTSLTRLRRLGLVSVCLIEGYAIGGGAEITTSTDFRVMKEGEKSYIRFIHNRLSLCQGWGGASRLTQILGRKKALQVLLQAEKLHAAKAFELGFVDDILTGDALEGAKTFLSEYTQYNVNSTRAIKRLVASKCVPFVTMQMRRRPLSRRSCFKKNAPFSAAFSTLLRTRTLWKTQTLCAGIPILLFVTNTRLILQKMNNI